MNEVWSNIWMHNISTTTERFSVCNCDFRFDKKRQLTLRMSLWGIFGYFEILCSCYFKQWCVMSQLRCILISIEHIIFSTRKNQHNPSVENNTKNLWWIIWNDYGKVNDNKNRTHNAYDYFWEFQLVNK